MKNFKKAVGMILILIAAVCFTPVLAVLCIAIEYKLAEWLFPLLGVM